MSWPTDGGPRYVVSTLDGYRVTTQPSRARTAGRSWCVIDRAECHRLVREFPSEARLPIFGTSSAVEQRAHWEREAHALAATLNADEPPPTGAPARASTAAACEVWGERVTLGGIEWEPSAVPGLADFEPPG